MPKQNGEKSMADIKSENDMLKVLNLFNEAEGELLHLKKITEELNFKGSRAEIIIGRMRDCVNEGHTDIQYYPISMRSGLKLYRDSSDDEIASCFVSLFGRTKTLFKRLKALANIMSIKLENGDFEEEGEEKDITAKEFSDLLKKYDEMRAELYKNGYSYNEYWVEQDDEDFYS